MVCIENHGVEVNIIAILYTGKHRLPCHGSYTVNIQFFIRILGICNRIGSTLLCALNPALEYFTILQFKMRIIYVCVHLSRINLVLGNAHRCDL